MFDLHEVKYKAILSVERLTIEEGVVTCIVGKSGGGKTTLLRLLNKMISPTEGKILFRNQDLDEIDSIVHRKEVSLLSQQPVMFDGSIKDNLLFATRLDQQEDASDKQLEKLLEELQVSKQISDDASQCSGGEKQRIALGRILLNNSKVLLLDEPSSALDETTEKILLDVVLSYANKRRLTVVLVTHSMDIARTYGQRLIKMEQGKVVK